MASASPLVAIYADESCLGNGRDGENPGGAGLVVEYLTRSGAVIRRDAWVAEPATTNNRMALNSVVVAFRAIATKGHRFRVVFTTDSRYIVDGMTRWVHDWARRDWRRKSGAVENLDLWQEAVLAIDENEVLWRWVRGHARHAQNEYANHLAMSAAADQTDSGGLRESGFNDWMASRGARTLVEPFPEASAFRPHAGLPTAPGERPEARRPR